MADYNRSLIVKDELPEECDDSLVLNRYINQIPDKRLTRQRKQAQEETCCPDTIRSETSKTCFDRLSTSDYSSAGSSKLSYKPHNPGHSSAGPVSPTSDVSSRRHELSSPENDQLTDVDVNNDTLLAWDSDTDTTLETDTWERQADFRHLDSVEGAVVEKQGVVLLVPHTNHHDIPNNKFSITILPDKVLNPQDFLLSDSLHYLHISPIVQIHPHGHLFTSQHAAYVYIPLTHNLDQDTSHNLVCLSTTSPTNFPSQWTRTRVQRSHIIVHQDTSYLAIKTCVLGTFTVIYEDQAEVVRKTIRRRIGGSIMSDHVPGLCIKFPRGSCQTDVEAQLKIYHNVEPYHRDNVSVPGVLACPIIMITPHGRKFGNNVRIELPVPNYTRVKETHPQANLIVYHSQSRSGQALRWRRLEPDKISIHFHKNGTHTVSFSVNHFSFFKLVWDIVSERFSYFTNWIALPMKCEAYMQEDKDTNTFSLEVICFKTDTTPNINRSTYNYLVGTSNKPKLVKPGNIRVKLNSKMFLPNVDAGEEEVLEKVEMNFKGADFSKQFACVFAANAKVDKGTFGKVFVDRIADDKEKIEGLFELNLTKQGVESEQVVNTGSDVWSVVAIKNLVSSMGLENEWKKFADYIGLTKLEIEVIENCQADPFIEIMNKFRERGGTAEAFVNKLYTVSRDMNIEAALSPGAGDKGRSPGSASSSGVSGSGSQNSQEHIPSSFTRRFSLFNLNPWKTHEDSDSGTADHDGGFLRPRSNLDQSPTGSRDTRESRKRSMVDKTPSSSRSVKRSRIEGRERSFSRMESFSNRNDSLSSSDDESGAEEDNTNKKAKTISTNSLLRNNYKFCDNDLWKISAEMNSVNWRALGRTLGLEEAVLLNTEQNHKNIGTRECAYQMMLEWKENKPKNCTFSSLYKALTQEKMNGIAKNLVKLLEEGNFKKQ